MERGNWISGTPWTYIWASAKSTVVWNHLCDDTTLKVHAALLKQKNSQLIQLLAMNKSSVTINKRSSHLFYRQENWQLQDVGK